MAPSLFSPAETPPSTTLSAPRLARVDWMDWSKALSILAVVAIHAIHWGALVGASAPILDLAVTTLMPVQDFFFVSGVLIAAPELSSAFRPFFRSKIAPVLALYVIWQPVVVLYKVVASATLPDQLDSEFPQQLLRLVSAPLRPNGELWYLWALIIYLLAARATRRLPALVTLIGAGALSIAWTSVARPAVGPELWRILGPGWHHLPECLVFFLLGISGRGAVLRWTAKAPLWALIGMPILYWALIRAVFVFELADLPGVTFLRITAAAAAILCSGVLLARAFGSCRFGAATLPIYLMHTLVIVVVVAAAHGAGLRIHSPAGSITLVLALIAIAVGASLGLWRAAAGTRLSRVFAPRFRTKDRREVPSH